MQCKHSTCQPTFVSTTLTYQCGMCLPKRVDHFVSSNTKCPTLTTCVHWNHMLAFPLGIYKQSYLNHISALLAQLIHFDGYCPEKMFLALICIFVAF